MKTPESVGSVLLIAVLTFGLVACSDSKKEEAARERERQRLESERQAQADAAKANKAITTNNQKMFSRMNASSPGEKATDSGTAPAESSPKK